MSVTSMINVTTAEAERVSTRRAYGEILRDIGSDEKVVVLDADVSSCTMSCMFREVYPERFFNVGIAEANMVGMAAGMAAFGMKPFVSAFAMFIAGRTFDQIRNSVAYPGLSVKLVGTHAGLTVGEDGATHQCLEDIALMRSIPGMTVLCPADGNETKAAVRAIKDLNGPVYLRLGRALVRTVTDYTGHEFTVGKFVTMREGCDVTIIACGIAVEKSLDAAETLVWDGIQARVINLHTIKPIDEDAIIRAARETGAIVTVEEHNVLGGMGSAVSEVVAESCPVPVLKIGTMDKFGQSGDADKLLEMHGITAANVALIARKALQQKLRYVK